MTECTDQAEHSEERDGREDERRQRISCFLLRNYDARNVESVGAECFRLISSALQRDTNKLTTRKITTENPQLSMSQTNALAKARNNDILET